jgi:hypothetical protein
MESKDTDRPRQERLRLQRALAVMTRLCGAAIATATFLRWLTAHWSDHPDEHFTGWALASDTHGHSFYDQAGAFSGRAWSNSVDTAVVVGPGVVVLLGIVMAGFGVALLVLERRTPSASTTHRTAARVAAVGFVFGFASMVLAFWDMSQLTHTPFATTDLGVGDGLGSRGLPGLAARASSRTLGSRHCR